MNETNLKKLNPRCPLPERLNCGAYGNKGNCPYFVINSCDYYPSQGEEGDRFKTSTLDSGIWTEVELAKF